MTSASVRYAGSSLVHSSQYSQNSYPSPLAQSVQTETGAPFRFGIVAEGSGSPQCSHVGPFSSTHCEHVTGPRREHVSHREHVSAGDSHCEHNTTAEHCEHNTAGAEVSEALVTFGPSEGSPIRGPI